MPFLLRPLGPASRGQMLWLIPGPQHTSQSPTSTPSPTWPTSCKDFPFEPPWIPPTPGGPRGGLCPCLGNLSFLLFQPLALSEGSVVKSVASSQLSSSVNGVTSSRWASLLAQTGKNQPAMLETQVQSLGREDPLAWQPTPVFLPGESPWTEKPGGLQSMGLKGVGHD